MAKARDQGDSMQELAKLTRLGGDGQSVLRQCPETGRPGRGRSGWR